MFQIRPLRLPGRSVPGRPFQQARANLAASTFPMTFTTFFGSMREKEDDRFGHRRGDSKARTEAPPNRHRLTTDLSDNRHCVGFPGRIPCPTDGTGPGQSRGLPAVSTLPQPRPIYPGSGST